MRRAAAVLAATGALAGLASVPAAHADAPRCVSEFWMVGLRGGQRALCDSPIRADGSWIRGRAFSAPAYTAPAWGSCVGGLTFCYSYPAHDVAALVTPTETYTVTPDTVPAGEPGHIGGEVLG